MTNEIANVENQETEIVEAATVRETENYAIVKGEDGKFKRKAKFKSTSTITAESRADKVWLMNLFEGTDEKSDGLKGHVGKEIHVTDIITQPYDKVNEDTGVMEYGVITYLITADRVAYATSSKNVYFSVERMIGSFGNPSKEEPFILKVLKEKAQNGDMIKIKLVG